LNFKPESTLLRRFVVINAERTIAGYKEGGANKLKNDEATVQKAFVWKKRGDSLIEKRIFIGLNDDTNAKVVKGLSPNEEVITNVVKGENKDNTNTNDSQRSPFMPQMHQRPSGSHTN
jgi:HlyD family secretion protein